MCLVEIGKDVNVYTYVRAYGRLFGQTDEEIETEVEKASRDHAPATAVRRLRPGEWQVVREMHYRTKERLRALVAKLVGCGCTPGDCVGHTSCRLCCPDLYLT